MATLPAAPALARMPARHRCSGWRLRRTPWQVLTFNAFGVALHARRFKVPVDVLLPASGAQADRPSDKAGRQVGHTCDGRGRCLLTTCRVPEGPLAVPRQAVGERRSRDPLRTAPVRAAGGMVGEKAWEDLKA